MTAPASALQEAAARRRAAAAVIAERCDVLVSACEAIAARFASRGTLFVFGSGAAISDAAHVAVEFVHPVIIGKRSLPAVALSAAAGFGDPVAVFAEQIQLLARPGDIALGIAGCAPDAAVLAGLRAAAERGLLTIALSGGDGVSEDTTAADFALHVPCTDPLVVKEVHVTAYHLLWELVHVYLDRPDVPALPDLAETALRR
ncbi:MAG TPA: SIS domain-containing protein [Mycobacteriales bacterium]|nr:SIS domain-containing protein [Mycobacteriales bacterium]